MEKARAKLFDRIVVPRALSATRLHAAKRFPKQALLPNSGGQGVSGFWRWNPSRGGVRRNNAAQTIAATRRLTLCGATMPASTCAGVAHLLTAISGPQCALQWLVGNCCTMLNRTEAYDAGEVPLHDFCK